MSQKFFKGVDPHDEPSRVPFSCYSLLVPVERNGSAEIFAQLLKIIGNLPCFLQGLVPKITAIVHATPTEA